MTEGWIKLHRKMLDNPIVCKDGDHIAVWIYLLLNATHKNYLVLFNGNKIELQPGQLITGRKSIAESLNINEYKVHRILKCFEDEQQIAQQTSNKNRLISILKWDEYQTNAQQDAQQMHNNCTTTAHKQECKNEKNEKNKMSIPPSYEEVEAYCRERNNGINAQNFIDFYQARGWMIGKAKMKDWKASVRTWEQRRKEIAPAPKRKIVR